MMKPKEHKKEYGDMADNITKNLRAKISKYVIIADLQNGNEWIKVLKRLVFDCLSMEPMKETRLNNVHLIVLTWF